MFIRTLVLMTLFLLLCYSISAAPLGNAFTYQGRIQQNSTPMNGPADLQFSLWDAASVGNQLGSMITLNDVAVANGLFTVQLNMANEFGVNAFNGSARWLRIDVRPGAGGSYTTLAPRQLITSAPYALFAAKPWATTTGTTNIFYTGGRVGIGQANPAYALDVNAASPGIRLGLQAKGGGALVLANNQNDNSIYMEGFNSNSNGNAAKIALTGYLGASLPLFEILANTTTLSGRMGIGTSDPHHRLRISGGPSWTSNAWAGALEFDNAAAFGWQPNAFGQSFGIGQSTGGLYFFRSTSVPGTIANPAEYDMMIDDFGNVGIGTTSPSAKLHVNLPGGTAVYGNGHYGVYGAGTYGVFGSGTTAGLYGSGGTYGVYGGGSSYGVYGSGTSYGVYGSGSTGVYGTGSAFGLYGSSNDKGVYATSPNIAFYGQSSGQAGGLLEGAYIGVQGTSTGSDPNRQAIRGENFASATGYAGIFNGNVYVFGSLGKAGGSFKIDHPLDPANKFLSHSFVESPDMMNIYNGNATTDAKGYANITLPNWFQALNKEFRYQLTVIDSADSDQFVQAKVVKEIEKNQFTIRSSQPNTKISWQVTGIRQDVWANAHRIPVEEEKGVGDRGKYLTPDLYGQPKAKGIAYQSSASPLVNPNAGKK